MGHYQATGPKRDQQIDPLNQRTWAIHARCHPSNADELLTTTDKTILPTFNTRTEAQEEADRLNVINQSVIGAKEGVVEAVSKLVGSDITDAIL